MGGCHGWAIPSISLLVLSLGPLGVVASSTLCRAIPLLRTFSPGRPSGMGDSRDARRGRCCALVPKVTIAKPLLA